MRFADDLRELMVNAVSCRSGAVDGTGFPPCSRRFDPSMNPLPQGAAQGQKIDATDRHQPSNWLNTARNFPGLTGLFSSGAPSLCNDRRHWSLRSAVMITAGMAAPKCSRKCLTTSQPTTP
ncbi:hypothetical protein D9M71_584520 [compost metagenome]